MQGADGGGTFGKRRCCRFATPSVIAKEEMRAVSIPCKDSATSTSMGLAVEELGPDSVMSEREAVQFLLTDCSARGQLRTSFAIEV